MYHPDDEATRLPLDPRFQIGVQRRAVRHGFVGRDGRL